MSLLADVHSREQRLRKQAELQSLMINLANLRGREATFIDASAVIPELLLNQINEMRHEVAKLEDELLALGDEEMESPARQFYRDGFEAELMANDKEAMKWYKVAARYEHPDATAAIRSLRYQSKIAKQQAEAKMWSPMTVSRSRNQLTIGFTILVMFALVIIVIFTLFDFTPNQTSEVVAVIPTGTITNTTTTPLPTPPKVILVATATPIPTATPTPTLTNTPEPTAIIFLSTATPTLTPTPTRTLKPAPQVIDPRDGLVWKAGNVVFEFEALDLEPDELYCINTLRGYDETHTENWSFPPVGSEKPAVPIEASIFEIAQVQGIKCIVWSASIGKGSCGNTISHSSAERVIGLPRPCDFDK